MSAFKDLKEYVYTVCKIGQGKQCCSYLLVGSKGFECAKLDDKALKLLKSRIDSGQMVSQGNNCEGRDLIALEEIENSTDLGNLIYLAKLEVE